MDFYRRIRNKFTRLSEEKNLGAETVNVRVRTLSPEEAIGNPEDKDYPLTKGRERMMEAELRGCFGQAFTDMYGNFSGDMNEVLHMDLNNNFRRAVFLASFNAVTRYLGISDKTVHCKDEAPPRCARELVSYIRKNYGQPRIAMVGLQPRMVEALSSEFDLRVVDMDEDNIGHEKFGVTIGPPEDSSENLAWCDLALVTGSALTNDTLKDLIGFKQTLVFGVTIAGPAACFGLTRFCPYGS
ncbi:MAG: Rossmann-like domain-containing protein [Desulfomonilaceae bacterium]